MSLSTGEVAAARDNDVCGVGVAYDSLVAGVACFLIIFSHDAHCKNRCIKNILPRDPYAGPALHDRPH